MKISSLHIFMKKMYKITFLAIFRLHNQERNDEEWNNSFYCFILCILLFQIISTLLTSKEEWTLSGLPMILRVWCIMGHTLSPKTGGRPSQRLIAPNRGWSVSAMVSRRSTYSRSTCCIRVPVVEVHYPLMILVHYHPLMGLVQGVSSLYFLDAGMYWQIWLNKDVWVANKKCESIYPSLILKQSLGLSSL